MRIFSLALSLFIVACGGQADGTSGTGALAENSLPIMCMVDGETQFEPLCSLRQSTGEDGSILTLSSPSGGFRRLLVIGDGRGVVAADGAVPAIVRPLGAKTIEVTIGNDRYRIPANVKQAGRESR